ncbi:MAG: Y-family DNA polymerase [Rikenellaceae bacterium]
MDKQKFNNYYLLIDCNNFFVSCERVFRPDLKGRAVVVLSSNDGCIIARSNEAKALGIAMGEPLFKVRDIIRRNKVEIFSSNHTLYGDFSRRVMSLLRSVAPAIEVYSIDEAFADMRGVKDDFDIVEYAKNVIKLIDKGCGIPVSIGIAPTKTLAKLASRMVKKGIMGGDGVCLLKEQNDIEFALRSSEIGDIWGIGRKSVVHLRRNGIETALDFARTSSSWIHKTMTIRALRTWRELNSIESIEFLYDAENEQQSIMVSRSFTREIADFESLSAALANFITSATDKLRKQHSATKQISVIAQTNRFSKSQTNYSESRIYVFDTPTDSVTELIEVGVKILKSIYREGVGYKKTGVIFSSLVDKSKVLPSLFDNIDRSRQTQIMNVLDTINSRHGKGTLVSARRSFEKLPVSGDKVSPCYTTVWSDILVVK